MAKQRGQPSRNARRGRTARRLGLEWLEPRRLLAPLSPGGSLSPVPIESDPVGGVVIATQQAPFGGIGSLTSNVIGGDTSNPFGGLTFTYQVFNNAGGGSTIDTFSVLDFLGLATDVSRRSVDTPPIQASRLNADTISFLFGSGGGGGISPGNQSSLLVIQTNDDGFSSTSASVSTASQTFQVNSYAPFPDNVAPEVSVFASDAFAAEPGDPGEFTFSLTQPNAIDTKITYSVGGSATPGLVAGGGSDYQTLSGTVVIPAGLTSKTVPVFVFDDPALEGLETVDIKIVFTSDPGVTVDPSIATVNIADNEAAKVSVAGTANAVEPATDGKFTFTLTGGPSPTDTIINYTVRTSDPNDATPGVDYVALSGNVTIPAGSISKDVVVDVFDDSKIEPVETVFITINTVFGLPGVSLDPAGKTATITIADNEVLGAGGQYEFEATQSSATEPGVGTFPRLRVVGDFSAITNAADRTVNLTATGGNATLGVDYKLANFVIPRQNFSTPQVFNLTTFSNAENPTPAVSIINDSISEGTETFTLLASDTSKFMDATDVDGADGLEESTQHTIVDDDKTAVNISASDPNAAEPADNGEFTFTLTQLVGTPTTVFFTVGGFATSGTDYKSIGTSVVIPAGQLSKTVAVQVIDDGAPEISETVVVNITGTSDPGVAVGSTSQAIVTIADNEGGLIAARVAATDSTATEGGDPGLFRVSLSSPSASGTTITYSIGGTATNGVDYNPLNGSAFIPAGAIEALIPINPIDDALVDPAETVTLTLLTTSNPTIIIDGSANTATVTIIDNEVNLGPTITTNTGSTVAAGGTDTITAAELTATDPNTPPGNLVYTVTSPPANGTLRVNGNPSATFTQAQINSGSVTYTHNGGPATGDSFAFSISDGQTTVSGNVFSITITQGGNNPPDAVDDKATTPTNNKIQINVLANDTDPNNDVLSIVAVGAAANGQASIGAGVISYQPNPNFVGVDSFTYTISDGRGGTDTATVTVTVGSQQLGANDDTFQVNEDTIRNPLDVLKNDIDPEGDNFKVTDVTQGAKGVVEVGPNGANVLYTPDPNFTGTDTFTYTITDSTGKMDTAMVTVTIADLGEPPLAVDDKVTVLEDSPPSVINVLANDSDPDGGTFKITAVTQGANGTVNIRPGGLDLTYQPIPNFFGVDTFTYTITDNSGITDTATVTVIITDIIDNPSPVDDTFIATEDQVVTLTEIQITGNDINPDVTPVDITKVFNAIGGAAVLNADDSVTFTPNLNFNGPASFDYEIAGAILNDFGRVTINYQPVNDAPDVVNDSFSTAINTPISGTTADLLANDTDPEGDPLTVVSISNQQGGTVVFNATTKDIAFVPAKNFVGVGSFNYTVSDGQGGFDTGLVTINVVQTNQAPVANNDTFSASRGVANFFGDRGVLANDTDPESDAITKATVLTGASNGVVVLNLDGSFTYTSNPAFLGTDSFTYTAFDAKGASDTASVTINVIDAPPEGKADELRVGFNTPTFIDVLNNDSDPEGAPLEVVAVTQATNGKVTFTADGVTYEPNPGFVGNDQFTYTVSDDAGGINAAATAIILVNVSVLGSNFSYFPNTDDFARPEDTVITLAEADLLSNDYAKDKMALDIASISDPIGGAAVLNPDDSVTFTPTLDFVGEASFKYRFVAPFHEFAGLVRIEYTPDLDAPVSLDDAVTVSSDGSTKDVSVLVNDTDVDGDFLTVSAVSEAQRGSVEIGLFGLDVVYTPPPNFIGSDTFSYTVSDGNGGVDTATVTVSVGSTIVGTAGDDEFLLRRDALGTSIEVFANETGAGAPILSAPAGSVSSLLFDMLGGNDDLIVDLGSGTPVPVIEYRGGTGGNTLNIQAGRARIDASVDAGGTLDTTVGIAAELITNRFRQRSLTLAAGSRATVLAAGTLDAVSRLNTLIIGTGATLDINDNALVLDYTGASPEAGIRTEIIEGRGGVGIGNGNWNGTGITSGAAATANALDPESRSIGYADNGTLPLGAYATFRGQPVDATSILIAFTRTADANLDSLVNDDDVTVLGAFFPGTNYNWASGDFDFTDTVDDNDATLLGAFYNPAAARFPGAPSPWLASIASALEAHIRETIFADLGKEPLLPFRRKR